MKTMRLNEFVEDGYLQEVNRQFFHPLGLALVVQVNDHGEYRLDAIADAREDPEGFTFDGFDDLEVARGHDIEFDQWVLKRNRELMLGFDVQPLVSKHDSTKEDDPLMDKTDREWCGKSGGECEKQCGGCARL